MHYFVVGNDSVSHFTTISDPYSIQTSYQYSAAWCKQIQLVLFQCHSFPSEWCVISRKDFQEFLL